MTAQFNPFERAILNSLYRARRPLSTRQVAEKTGISSVTAKKYLAKLSGADAKYVTKKELGGKTIWRINLKNE